MEVIWHFVFITLLNLTSSQNTVFTDSHFTISVNTNFKPLITELDSVQSSLNKLHNIKLNNQTKKIVTHLEERFKSVCNNLNKEINNINRKKRQVLTNLGIFSNYLSITLFIKYKNSGEHRD